MKNAGLLDAQSGSVSFCGIIAIEDCLHVFMPKAFKSRDNKLEDARLLLSSIRKYAQNRGSISSLNDLVTGEIIGISPVIAVDLLQDYLQTGLYKNTVPEIRHQTSGKIAWPQVIKSKIPFLRDDNTPVYPELLVRKLNYFSSNDVTRIHAAVIAYLDSLFGWYFTGTEKLAAPELHGCKLPFHSKRAVLVLKRELRKIFADREMRLLKNLIAILEKMPVEDKNDADIVTGLSSFEHVWEDICSVIYQNEGYRFRGEIPYPAYTYAGGRHEPAKSNKQRMDLIIQQGDKIAILDAKYYDFARSSPGWGDIVKQLYYVKSLSAVMPDKKFLNYFVVPAPDAGELPRQIRILDKGEKPLDADFPPVNILYTDVRQAMRDYVSGKINPLYRDEVFGGMAIAA